MKGTAKSGTVSNIKPMQGGGAIASLSNGQYVFGDLSAVGTDIINFSHYYREDGTKVLLPVPCKVTTANLILEDVEENTDPIPDPEPEPTNKLVPLTVTIEGEGYKSVTVDLIPNDAD